MFTFDGILPYAAQMGGVAACTMYSETERKISGSGHFVASDSEGSPGEVAEAVKGALSDGGAILQFKGQAFCFLPLPVFTQLPVHVNGYFELSSNRRDIWRGEDTSGESRVRGEWNNLLMRDAVA